MCGFGALGLVKGGVCNGKLFRKEGSRGRMCGGGGRYVYEEGGGVGGRKISGLERK